MQLFPAGADGDARSMARRRGRPSSPPTTLFSDRQRTRSSAVLPSPRCPSSGSPARGRQHGRRCSSTAASTSRFRSWPSPVTGILPDLGTVRAIEGFYWEIDAVTHLEFLGLQSWSAGRRTSKSISCRAAGGGRADKSVEITPTVVAVLLLQLVKERASLYGAWSWAKTWSWLSATSPSFSPASSSPSSSRLVWV